MTNAFLRSLQCYGLSPSFSLWSMTLGCTVLCNKSTSICCLNSFYPVPTEVSYKSHKTKNPKHRRTLNHLESEAEWGFLTQKTHKERGQWFVGEKSRIGCRLVIHIPLSCKISKEQRAAFCLKYDAQLPQSMPDTL